MSKTFIIILKDLVVKQIEFYCKIPRFNCLPRTVDRSEQKFTIWLYHWIFHFVSSFLGESILSEEYPSITRCRRRHRQEAESSLLLCLLCSRSIRRSLPRGPRSSLVGNWMHRDARRGKQTDVSPLDQRTQCSSAVTFIAVAESLKLEG